MAGDNAELGFSVDTSQVETATKRLDELSKAATGATESATGLSDAVNKLNGAGGMTRGKMGNIVRDFSTLQNNIVNDISETGERAGRGFFSNFINSLKTNHAAQRELGVMSHELMSGNLSRLRGSASIFMSNLGMGGLAGTGLILGGMELFEGFERVADDLGEASKAMQDLQTSAAINNDYSLLNPQYVQNLYSQVDHATTSFTSFQEAVANAVNAGVNSSQMSSPFLKAQSTYEEAMSRLTSDQQAQFKKVEDGLDKAFADPLSNFKSNFEALKGSMSQAQQDSIISAAKAGDEDKTRLLMQSAITDQMEKQALIMNHLSGADVNFKDESYWQSVKNAFSGFGETFDMLISGDNSALWSRAEASSKQHVQKYHELVNNFRAGTTKPEDLNSATLSLHKALNPSLHTHHGLTDAEKAAKRLLEYQTQIKQTGLQFDQQINSIGDSVNKAWTNKLYSYSMTSDQHDFANRIEQINEQFDRMRENVDRLALQHHKSIGSKEYVEMFQKIELGRKNVLAENMAGYDEMQSYQKSVLAGMNAGWIKYQKQVDDVASQSEKVFDTAVNGMTDALTNFFTTGEAGWTNFVKSIAAITEKYMVQDWIVEPLAGFVKEGVSGLFSSHPTAPAANSFAVPDIPKFGATRLGGGLGSTAPVVNITVNDNGNKGGVSSDVNATTGQMQKLGVAISKMVQEAIKKENVNSNRQGGINKSMGNWSTR
ncbi:phage tail tape-measure protein [Salmonella enterica]|nr:phage tail tape-measure protein [Salmonella enterica]ELW2865951.1 phage tail tape-measure protein [Salmonella enterica]